MKVAIYSRAGHASMQRGKPGRVARHRRERPKRWPRKRAKNAGDSREGALE